VAGVQDQLFARFGRTCEAGEVLFREHEQGDTMFVLQSGAVRITKETRDGVKTLAVLGPGEFFGEMAILNAKPRNATADVVERARVLVIDKRTFEQMVVSNAEIAVRLIKKLAARLDSANELIEVLLHRDPRARVILGLSRRAELEGQPLEDGSVVVNLSEQQLAEDIGVTPEEVTDVLHRLRRLRIVEDVPTGLRIHHLSRLTEFLEFLEMQNKYGEP
jgi:CRP-like cAMP-binding protein